MATLSRILAWRIPWTEAPGGLQSLGSHRVGHDWSDQAVAAANEGISLECLLGRQYHWLAWATIHFPWLPQHSFVPPLDFSIIDFIIQHRWNICHALAHCRWVAKSWTAFVTPRTAARQTSLSFTIAQSWRLNCTLGFCRGITNGHRTQNIHIHTNIYTHIQRERDRGWDWLILKSWLRGSRSLRSPNIHSQQSGDLGEPIVQFQSKNWRAWDPKRACFSLSLKTERLKSSSRQSSARSFLLRGECPFWFQSGLCLDEVHPLGGGQSTELRLPIQIFSSKNTLTYTGNIWPNIWAACYQLTSLWALGWAWFTVLSSFLVSEKPVHLLPRPVIPTCAPRPVLSCC